MSRELETHSATEYAFVTLDKSMIKSNFIIYKKLLWPFDSIKMIRISIAVKFTYRAIAFRCAFFPLGKCRAWNALQRRINLIDKHVRQL